MTLSKNEKLDEIIKNIIDFYRQMLYTSKMIITYLRTNNIANSISNQQELILNYAKSHGLAIDKEEIENTPINSSLDERKTFYEILHKELKTRDEIIIEGLWVFGNRVGEMIKVLNCLLKREVIIHLCSQNVIINSKLPISILLEILDRQRELISKKTPPHSGRPKGSLSKSKFDKYKEDIIKMLRDKLSVSEIALKLEVSRSSLKDYINSRNLKKLALIDKEVDSSNLNQESFLLPDSKNCKLK